MTLHNSENQPLLSPKKNEQQDIETGNNNNDINSTYETNLAPPSLANFRHVHFQPTLSKIGSSTSLASIKTSITSRLSAVSQRGADASACRPADDSFHFGARVATLVLVASLFATNQIPLGKDMAGHDIVWPQGMWVTISTLMVCWFPKLDAASVIQKSLQRLGGTLLGGCMGLVCGSLSRHILPIYVNRRAIFLHASYALGCFVVTYLSMKIRLSRTSTIMAKYNYGTVLCLLTFTIALFPFLEQQDPWKKAIYRIVNVAMGCLIAAVGSMLVLPRSTTDMLLQRVQKQCQWAGESSEAVLHAAADVLEGEVGTVPQGIRQDLLQEATALAQAMSSSSSPGKRRTSHSETSQDHHSVGRLGNLWSSIRVSALHKTFYRVNQEIMQDNNTMGTALDVVLEKYESAIRDWKDTKGLFQLFRFDPFHWIVPASQEFREGCDTILSRALRIQTTVVLLDGIVRNDPDHLLFLDETLFALLTEMGTLIRKMLTVPRQPATQNGRTSHAHLLADPPSNGDATVMKANDVAKSRLLDRLYCFRNLVNQMANNMIQTESLMESIACGCSPHTTGQDLEQQSSSCGQARCRRRATVVNPGSKHYALLFLQLVEHLTHRSISLYDSWVAMEEQFCKQQTTS